MKPLENQTVVVPFDFSDPARQAIDQVLAWSSPATTIHLIHAVEPTTAFISLDPAMPIPPSFDAEAHRHALTQLDEMFGDGEYKRLKVTCEIGDPGSLITSLAESVHADVIVMPSHGRTGLSRLFLGSVAERVLRLAHCPVLVLRGKPIQQPDEAIDIASATRAE